MKNLLLLAISLPPIKRPASWGVSPLHPLTKSHAPLCPCALCGGGVRVSCPLSSQLIFSPSPIPSTAPLTIYRKPEAKGWGDTFGGRPVKLISEKP
ncbi:hypothetical protein OAF75_02970 [Verrucomicrobiales bacterium]|nr:hypothetical protein [Verrucomicrobiales bacterium]